MCMPSRLTIPLHILFCNCLSAPSNCIRNICLPHLIHKSGWSQSWHSVFSKTMPLSRNICLISNKYRIERYISKSISLPSIPFDKKSFLHCFSTALNSKSFCLGEVEVPFLRLRNRYSIFYIINNHCSTV